MKEKKKYFLLGSIQHPWIHVPSYSTSTTTTANVTYLTSPLNSRTINPGMYPNLLLKLWTTSLTNAGKEEGKERRGKKKEDGKKMEGRIPPLIVVSCSLLFAFFVAFALPLLPLPCLCLAFAFAFVLPLRFLSCLLFICQAPLPPLLPPPPPLPAAAHRPTKAKTAEKPEETNVPKKTRNWTPSVKRHVCGITWWNILISNFPRTSPPSNLSSSHRTQRSRHVPQSTGERHQRPRSGGRGLFHQRYSGCSMFDFRVHFFLTFFLTLLFEFLFEFLFDVLFDALFDNHDFLTFVLFHVLHQSLRARRNVPGTSKKC